MLSAQAKAYFGRPVSGRTIHHIRHKHQSSQVTDTLVPERIRSFRTDMVHSDRMQAIRGVQAGLYSCAVFLAVDSKQSIHS
jgi:hypothetical protein